MRAISERRVRVAEGWGRRDGAEILLDDGRRIPEIGAEYLAPVEPSKIFAVHLSYRSRVEEYGARIPSEPSYFLKPPSALAGHRGVIRRPAGGRFLNYEGELAVVVGRRMKAVREHEALAYVAGYSCANDVGLHDFRHTDRGSMLRVKGQDGFLPLGPELVPASELDPTAFMLRTYVNGEVVQETKATDLLFPVAYQLADLCRLITLEPGDVLLTGTPANSRPMEPGDLVEVEIDGVGRLSSTVVESETELTGPGALPDVTADTIHVALAVPEDDAERMAARA
jgi:5-oxopent-3-ene-1,2,5-tricarboxylate decarboxylase/2-hydroxyhepta-2,4-diene-1,7-dioate isomerase